MPIRAKITVMLFSIRIFLLILFVLLRIQIHDKSKLLCCRSPISSVVHHFSKIFQLLPVLFSCAVSDFL